MFSTRVAVSAIAAGTFALLSVAPAANATFNCDDAALWINTSADTNEFRKYSPEGVLLDSFEVDSGYGDMALNADATVAYGSDDLGITSYLTADGTQDSIDAIVGDLNNENIWALSGMPNGKFLASGNPDGSLIYEIEPSGWGATQWGDLDDADASLPVMGQGGSWEAAGDYIMAPDGDIIAFANDSNFEGTFVVRINPDDHTDMTAVGRLPVTWGGARVGDNIYAALADGRIIRVNEFPTTAGSVELDYDVVVDTGLVEGVYGAAGTQDQYVGETGCNFGALASTGVDQAPMGLAGLALVTAGAAVFVARRRRV